MNAPVDAKTIGAIAGEALAAIDDVRQIETFSSRIPDFDFPAGYAVTAALRRLRVARGEKHLGRKVGFTNRLLWEKYGVDGPMWGDLYDTTVEDLAAGAKSVSSKRFSEPLIEPEVVFKFSAVPRQDMDDIALLRTIEWIALGFEIVQSIYPGWQFKAPDTVAGGGLHGALLIGKPAGPAAFKNLPAALGEFRLTLSCDGETADEGGGANVLGNPFSVLRHLMALLAGDPANPPLRSGEIVTTGSLTRALPVAAGQTWNARASGVPLDEISVTFT